MIAGLQQAAAPRASVRWLWASASMVAGLQHALQRLERLVAPAYGKKVAGLQHAERRLELPRLQASATKVAGQCTASSSWLGSATRNGASSSRGYRYRRAPLRLQDFGCRPAARVAAPRATGQCQGED
eukprot:scaffold13905_cov69-Phaeocystis_antarctica.AAC.1